MWDLGLFIGSIPKNATSQNVCVCAICVRERERDRDRERSRDIGRQRASIRMLVLGN